VKKAADPLAMVPERYIHRDGESGRTAAISVPGGLDAQGLPLGLQIIGRALDEATVFTLAGALEKAAAFKAKRRRGGRADAPRRRLPGVARASG